MSPCLAGQLIPALSEAATKHFNSSGIYENQTVIEQRGCFFIWKEWKVRLTLAFSKTVNYGKIIKYIPRKNLYRILNVIKENSFLTCILKYIVMKIICNTRLIGQALFVSSHTYFTSWWYHFFLVHEMAHAWHAILDYENEDLLENFSRVNETGIYEGQEFKEIFRFSIMLVRLFLI